MAASATPVSPAVWTGIASPPWTVVAASVRGPAHRMDGSPCQDAFAVTLAADRLVAVVSDGAGSARQAERGARETADHMAAALAAVPLDPAADGADLWRPAVEAAVESLRGRLLDLSRELGEPDDLSAFHATLVAAVATPRGGLFVHIGDGTAQAAGRPDSEPDGNGAADPLAPVAASPPMNGEEANSTFFVTLPFWRETLRLTPFGPCRRLVLMTDGPMPFAAAKGAAVLEPAFMGPVDAFLAANPPEEAAEALAATLESPKAARISGDDKTLLWAALLS